MMPFCSALLAKGAQGGASWSAASLPNLNGDNDAWAGYTLRQSMPAAGIPKNGSKLRFSFRGGNAEGITISKCYVQLKGAGVYDFSTTPIAVLFGGASSTTIGAATTVMCDDVTLAVTTSDSVVISVYTSGAPDRYRFITQSAGSMTPQMRAGYKSGDSAATVSGSGYTDVTASGWNSCFLEDFEVFG